MTESNGLPFIQYLAHSVHNGDEITYFYNGYDKELYSTLPNFYAISLVKKTNEHKSCLATVLVKTSLGQSDHETHLLFNEMVNFANINVSLNVDDCKLISTKINTASELELKENVILKFLTDMYTQNSVSGHA